jgi:hypothetical protein
MSKSNKKSKIVVPRESNYQLYTMPSKVPQDDFRYMYMYSRGLCLTQDNFSIQVFQDITHLTLNSFDYAIAS